MKIKTITPEVLTCVKTHIALAAENPNVTSESGHVSPSCSSFAVNVELKVSNTRTLEPYFLCLNSYVSSLISWLSREPAEVKCLQAGLQGIVRKPQGKK